MDVRGWFAEWFTEAVSVDKLTQPRARQLAALLLSGSYDGAVLQECWREPKDGYEILILRVNVPLGQRALVNAVEAEELVAVLIGRHDLLPHVYPLRDGFPDHVPHFNFAPKGQPRSLCLYEAPAEEVRRTYTAIAFMERVRWWFVETAYGRLHGNDQPLDPLFQYSGLALILPRTDDIKPGTIFTAARIADLDDSPVRLIPLTAENAGNLSSKQGVYASIFLITGPVEHGCIRGLPLDLEQLLCVYGEVDAEIRGSLSAALLDMLQSPHHSLIFDRPLLLIVKTPLTRQGGEVEAKTIKAYLSVGVTAGDIAIALGVLIRERGIWARPIGPPPQAQDLSEFNLVPADTHDPFDRTRARLFSGHEPRDQVPVALIGAGALGSQVALTACRGGHGRWAIVDGDFLLPHNLARHALGPQYLGQSKADALAHELNHLLGPNTAEAVHGNVLGKTSGDRWPGVLREVRQIIDASASVPVARWLACDSDREVRAASCFMSPSGKDAVVLIEGAGKAPRLDHLEMSYYRHLVSDERLEHHLTGGEVALYVGGCRSPSVKIPQTRVAAFSACMTEALCEQVWPEQGRISVWRSKSGLSGIDYITFDGESYEACRVGEWTVWVRQGLLAEMQAARTRADRLETGGILAGTWDRDRKIVYVVSHYDPPPDSKHEPTGFVRGMVGVFETIHNIHVRTAENLTYIGEWHTHPPGYGSRPSNDDKNLLWWVHDALQWSDAPALILIAGEDGYRVVLQDSPTNYQDALIEPLA